MSLKRLDAEHLYGGHRSSGRRATLASGSYHDALQSTRLANPALSSSNYYSDSDSGIDAPPHRASTNIRHEYSQYEPKRMSPKDRALMAETEQQNVLRNESILSTGEESEFWTYDDQSLLSEESVRRSCQQIYNARQRNNQSRNNEQSVNYSYNHAECFPPSSACTESDYLRHRNPSYNDGSRSNPTTPVSTLSRRTVPKIRVPSFIPQDIVRVYARPASVVPATDHAIGLLSNDQRPLPGTSYQQTLSPFGNNADSSRISLVSMDQFSWKKGSNEYATRMFKSQPCLPTSSSTTDPYKYGNTTAPLHPSCSDDALRGNVPEGRRAAAIEAFGNLNERNRTRGGQEPAPEANESSPEGNDERPSRGNQCRRSKSFVEKIQRGSLSFRSACSAFRRAFSQERIYRPEKQERQQRDYINSTAETKKSPALFNSRKEETSPSMSGGRHVVNGIKEKLGGGREIFATCNSYPSKLRVHRRKDKRGYQPPQLITTHVKDAERDSEKGGDVAETIPSRSRQDDYGGWFNDPSISDYDQRVWGHLIQLNVDGSQVIELSRLRGFHFGFFVARGRVKDNRGVFVSRMRDVLTQKTLSGILEVGDEILEIEGVDVRGADILNVNSMMANKQTLLLTILPYISRKDI